MRARTSANSRAVRGEREQARAAHDDRCDLCGAARGETGVCGIRRSEGRGLDFDHDHVGGGFRGLICWRANRWLARWVTPDFLRAAADYLERAAGDGPNV